MIIGPCNFIYPCTYNIFWRQFRGSAFLSNWTCYTENSTTWPLKLATFTAMQAVKLARNVFQVVALAIFAYQMVEALEKYFSFKRISFMETKDIEDTEMPSIFFCPAKQNLLDFTQNTAVHGYVDLRSFLKGSLKSRMQVLEQEEEQDVVSWEGMQNLSYSNVSRQLFNPIDTWNDVWIVGEPWTHWKTAKKNAAEYFIAYDGGFCKKIDIETRHIPELNSVGIVDIDDLQIIIANANKSLYYKLDTESLIGDPILPIKGLEKFYRIHFEEVQWSETAGECSHYGEEEVYKTFADCVAKEHEQIFEPILGCLVPWLSAPQNQNICKGRIHITSRDERNLTGKFMLIEKQLRLSKLDNMFNACLRPCRELKVYSKLVSEEKMLTSVYLTFEKTVKVIRYVEAYGLFDLVVEVGSSLGLWIGLSSLEVFDLLLKAGAAIQEKYWKKN